MNYYLGWWLLMFPFVIGMAVLIWVLIDIAISLRMIRRWFQ
jgi:hypothetical protein